MSESEPYLLENDSNFELNLDIMKENPDSEAAYRQTEATTSEKEFSDNRISHPNDSVKKQLKKLCKKERQLVLTVEL